MLYFLYYLTIPTNTGTAHEEYCEIHSSLNIILYYVEEYAFANDRESTTFSNRSYYVPIFAVFTYPGGTAYSASAVLRCSIQKQTNDYLISCTIAFGNGTSFFCQGTISLNDNLVNTAWNNTNNYYSKSYIPNGVITYIS